MKFTIFLVSSVVCFFIARMINENWLFLTSVFRGTIWLVAGVVGTSLLLGALVAFDTLKRRRAVNKSADDADIATNNQVQADATQQATLANERQLLANAWAGFELNQAQLELQLRALMAAVGIEQAKRGQAIITDINGLLTAPQSPRTVTNNLLGDGNAADADRRLQTLVADLMRFGADDAPQMRLVAPAGTGKSTLLHHFVDEVAGNVVLFQTHERIYPEDYATYGNKIHVVGMANEYGNANEFDDANKAACKHILHVAGIVTRRYQKGTRSPMLLIVDEWLDICDWANDNGYEKAVKALKMLSTTKARKAGVGVVLATQSGVAGAQGFKGAADVFKKMIAVELFKTESDYYAKVTRPGAEPLFYDLPGPHPIPVRQSKRKDEMAASMPYTSLADELAEAASQSPIPDAFDNAFDDDSAADELTDEQLKAMNVYQDMIDAPGTISKRQATQAAFGEGKEGTNYLNKLYRLWEGLNLDVQVPEFK